MDSIPVRGCCLFCEELLIGLDSACFATENSGIRHLHIAKEILDLSYRFHPLVGHFAV